MTERPINLHPHEVRGIIAGPQTQMRRIVKPQPELRNVAGAAAMWCFRRRGSDGYWLWPNAAQDVLAECPFGVPGDRLWGRETHMDLGGCVLYRADADAEQERSIVAPGQRWTPSIHMPRYASRILLEITDVRVQRVQEISEEDASAEGVDRVVTHATFGYGHALDVSHEYARGFRDLWASINGHDSWTANPWVWAITFRRLEP